MILYGLKSATHKKPPNMKRRKDKTDDGKRQRQHQRPNTNVDRHRIDKTKVSVQHQPYDHAFKNV